MAPSQILPTPILAITDLGSHQAEQLYGPTSICRTQEGMAGHWDVAPEERMHVAVSTQGTRSTGEHSALRGYLSSHTGLEPTVLFPGDLGS